MISKLVILVTVCTVGRAEDSLTELLQGAENGRYKVVAKAEPYKNLPPAPVTPDDFLDVTPAPRHAKVTYVPDFRRPGEDVKFAALSDHNGDGSFTKGKESAPLFTTPSPFHHHSPTPPAIEFIQSTPGPLEDNGQESPGIFKITVKNVDFRPTPPPPPPSSTTTVSTTTTRQTTRPTTTQSTTTTTTTRRTTPSTTRRPPPPPKRIHTNNGLKEKERLLDDVPLVKTKSKNDVVDIYHQLINEIEHEAYNDEDVLSNEVVTERDVYETVSKSIYDPRPRTRTYTKDFPRRNNNPVGRVKIKSKYRRRPESNIRKTIAKLPIRSGKKYDKNWSKEKLTSSSPKSSKNKSHETLRSKDKISSKESSVLADKKFDSDVLDFHSAEKKSLTEKRAHTNRHHQSPSAAARNHNRINPPPAHHHPEALPVEPLPPSAAAQFGPGVLFQPESTPFPQFLEPTTPQPIFLNVAPVAVGGRPRPTVTTVRPPPPPPSPVPTRPAKPVDPVFPSFAPTPSPTSLAPVEGVRSLPPVLTTFRQPPPPPAPFNSPPPPPSPKVPFRAHPPPVPTPPAHSPAPTLLRVNTVHHKASEELRPESYHSGEYTEYEEFKPRPYSFNYGVKDDYSGVDYNRAESRSDHGVTRGEYKVALPDGRIQIVSYVADDNGFHATVSYQGEPTYPEQEGYKEYAGNPYRESTKVVGPDAVFAGGKSAPVPSHETLTNLVTPHPTHQQETPISYTSPASPIRKTSHLAQTTVSYSPTPAPHSPIAESYKTPTPPTSYHPTPTAYSPTPAPYKGTPAPTYYSPTPASYSPTPVPYSPTPAPYSPTPAPYSPTPAPYSPTPASYSPTPAPYSPTPAPYSPTPAAYSPTPSPYSPSPYTPTPVDYSPSPSPYSPPAPALPLHHSIPLDEEPVVPHHKELHHFPSTTLSPKPVFHHPTSPAPQPLFVLGLKSPGATPYAQPNYSYDPSGAPRSLRSLKHNSGRTANSHEQQSSGSWDVTKDDFYSKYIEPTTWKPKYPKILEHTLRTTRRHLSGSRESFRSSSGEEYDYEYYD